MAPVISLTIYPLHSIQLVPSSASELVCWLPGSFYWDSSTILYLLQLWAWTNHCTGWQGLNTPLTIPTLYPARAAHAHQVEALVTQYISYIGVGRSYSLHLPIWNLRFLTQVYKISWLWVMRHMRIFHEPPHFFLQHFKIGIFDPPKRLLYKLFSNNVLHFFKI